MLAEDPSERKTLHDLIAQHVKYALMSSTRGLPERSPSPSKSAALHIPSPTCFDFTQTASNDNNRLTSIPTLAECAVHLELLEAVLVLRARVLKSTALDRLFWRLQLYFPPVSEKWRRFVALAVIRFSVWWDSLGIVLGEGKGPVQLDSNSLPPLDVLMIWHTFMLNPRYYNEAVKAHVCPYIADLEMPWECIHGIVNSIDRRYCLPEPASTLFTRCTGLRADLLDFLIETQVLSPSRDEILALFDAPSRATVRRLDLQLQFNPLSSDAQLARPMTGRLRSTRSPLSRLLAHVEADGTAHSSRVGASLDKFATGQNIIPTFERPFPLLQTKETRTQLSALLNTAARDQNILSVQTFGQLATSLQSTLPTPQTDNLLSSSPKAPSRLSNAIQWTILTYCSRYSTPTPLDASALRQSKFVEQMGRLLWIRSPALTSTLTHARSRYESFIKLFAIHPQTTLAPTPDIDLVWHTHQCSPVRYRTFATLQTGGTDINHDDGLGQGPIDEARKRTGNLYKAAFEEEYELCFCWDCEAVREAGEGLTVEDEAGLERVVEKVVEKVTFHRAVEVARRKGELV